MVGAMEDRGRIWAPARLLDPHPHVSQPWLHSAGIIQTEENRITFCHQSYLDFQQIADRLLREINDGNGSVRDWLGSKENQSLFRREQLRIVLSLLFEEEPYRFEGTVQDLIRGDGIRFHLQHLVLSMVGQIEATFALAARFCHRAIEGGALERACERPCVYGPRTVHPFPRRQGNNGRMAEHR